jgi:hypothetical protein
MYDYKKRQFVTVAARWHQLGENNIAMKSVFGKFISALLRHGYEYMSFSIQH